MWPGPAEGPVCWGGLMASLCPLPHLTWPPPLCPGASFQHHALGQHRPHRAKAQGPLCSGALNGGWAWLWQGGSVPACAGVSHTLLDPWWQSQANGSYLRQEGCGGDPLDLIHAAVCAQERLHHQGQPGACKLHHGTVEAGHTMQGRSLGHLPDGVGCLCFLPCSPPTCQPSSPGL